MKKLAVAVAVVLSSLVAEGPSPASTAERHLVEFAFHVTDERGRPFPVRTSGLMVCPSEAPLLACDPMIFGPADADGVARVTVDPAVVYRFTALVTGTGWPCGAWLSPDGTRFFFSEGLVARAGAAHRSGTFVIPEPVCPVTP
jgi:hypothetical protein